MARKYLKTARAEAEEHTRRRIVEAAIELHGTVGPAQTSFAAVALVAGLPRQTVYRHFEDEAALLGACSRHYLAGHPPPDPTRWLQELDPSARLVLALSEFYAYYRANAAILGNVLRDAATLPALQQSVELYRIFQRVARDTVASAWPNANESLHAAIGLALSFDTWRLLVLDQGLSDRRAVDLMVALATGKSA